jgi:sec-independent protein translocase protein TatA
MGHIGMPEMIFIALVIIVLFGAKKLPEIGSALGKAIREFKNAGKDIQKDVKDAIEDEGDKKKG